MLSRLRTAVFTPTDLPSRLGTKPACLDVLVFVCVVTGVTVWLTWASPAGRSALERSRQDTTERLSVTLSKEAYNRFVAQRVDYADVARRMTYAPVGGVLTTTVVLALLAQLLLNSALSLSIPFRLVTSVVMHASVILVIEYIAVGLYIFAIGELSGGITVRQLFPKAWPDQPGYFLSVLGALNIFVCWWLLAAGAAFGTLADRSLLLRLGPVVLYIGIQIAFALLRSPSVVGILGHGPGR